MQALYDRFPSPARNLLTSARGWFLTQFATHEKREQCCANCADTKAGHRKKLRFISFMLERTSPVHAAQFPSMPIIPKAKFAAPPTCKSCRYSIARRSARIRSVFFHAARRRASASAPAPLEPRAQISMSLTRRSWPAKIGRTSYGSGPGPVSTAPSAHHSLRGADRADKSVEPPYWTYNFPERQILMSIFHLSEKTAPDYLAF